jgi:hypothetical protein
LRITSIFAPICPRICARISGILAEDISASSSVNDLEAIRGGPS